MYGMSDGRCGTSYGKEVRPMRHLKLIGINLFEWFGAIGLGGYWFKNGFDPFVIFMFGALILFRLVYLEAYRDFLQHHGQLFKHRIIERAINKLGWW